MSHPRLYLILLGDILYNFLYKYSLNQSIEGLDFLDFAVTLTIWNKVLLEKIFVAS